MSFRIWIVSAALLIMFGFIQPATAQSDRPVAGHHDLEEPKKCRGISCVLKGGGIRIVVKPARRKKIQKRPIKKKPVKRVVKKKRTKTVKRPKTVKPKKRKTVRALPKPKPILPPQPPLEPSWEGLKDRPVITLAKSELEPLPSTFMLRFDPAILAAQGIDLTSVTTAQLASFLGLQPFQVRSIQRRFLPGAIVNISEIDRVNLSTNPAVLKLTRDTVIKPASQKPARLSWGLDRIDQAKLPLDGKFERKKSKGALRVYLLDSGVDRTHPEFGNRVVFGASFVPVIPAGAESYCKLHGTEMASLITGRTLGVAADIRLIDVTVLPCIPDESGSASSLIEGLYWVAEREDALRPRKLSLVNLSLTGPKSEDVNEWVDTLSTLGIAVVAAAGNQGEDACEFSPASAKEAITVGALDEKDGVTEFSNIGPCVKMNAPGFRVSAASAVNHNANVASNGTSAAAAYVSGILATNLTDIKERRGFNLLTSNAVNVAIDGASLLLAQSTSAVRADCRVSSSVQLLNLRSKPSTGASVLEKLPSTTKVELNAVDQNWANVRVASGKTGWVAIRANGKVLLTEKNSPNACQ